MTIVTTILFSLLQCTIFIADTVTAASAFLSYPIFIDTLSDLQNGSFLLQTFIFRDVNNDSSDVVNLMNPAEEHRFHMPISHLRSMESFYHGLSDTFASTGTPRMYVMHGERDEMSQLVLHERHAQTPLVLYNDANRVLAYRLQAKRWDNPPRNLIKRRYKYRRGEYWPLLHFVILKTPPFSYPCGYDHLQYTTLPLFDTYAEAREGREMNVPLHAQRRTHCLPFKDVSVVVLKPELRYIYVGYYNVTTYSMHSWLWSIDQATVEEIMERPILANVLHCLSPTVEQVKLSSSRRDSEWIILRIYCHPDEIGQYYTLNLFTKRVGILYDYDHYPRLNGLAGSLITFNEFDDGLRVSVYQDGICSIQYASQEMRVRLLYTNWTTSVVDYPRRFIDPCCECHALSIWHDNAAKANKTIQRYCPYVEMI